MTLTKIFKNFKQLNSNSFDEVLLQNGLIKRGGGGRAGEGTLQLFIVNCK